MAAEGGPDFWAVLVSLAGQEVPESAEVVSVDEIDSGVLHEFPGGGLVGDGPEADDSALGVGGLDHGFESSLVFGAHIAIASPGEVVVPVVADQGDELGGSVGFQVGDASVHGCVARGFCGQQVAWPVAGEDDRDRIGEGFTGLEFRQDILIAGEQGFQREVGCCRFSLEVDEEDDCGAVGIDPAAVISDAFAEGGEVETFEGPVGAGLVRVMGYEECALNEVDIGFDAAEAVVEGIEERAVVFVVVMSVGLGERCGVGRGG